MNPTIQQMQQDLERFRASKMGSSSVAESVPTTTPATPPPLSPAVQKGQAALVRYEEQKKAGTLQKNKKIKEDPSFLKEVARGIFSAPVTLAARPFQAVARVTGELAGQDITPQIDEFSSKISGGLIAPTPKNFGDVKKDVGRAAQSVALGTGAPIAGGALFGAGTSLEQGNDLFSAQTAFDAATGGAGGKVLEWVGKPILNATGKVVGTITPQAIKDAAAGGAQSIQKFMADNQLLGGVAAKPSAALATGLQKVDDVIEGGFKKAGTGAKNVIQTQYPNFSPTRHYTEINKKDILRPTTIPGTRYKRAIDVEKTAKKRGINLDEVGTRKGVIMDDLKEDGLYNSLEKADEITQQNIAAGNDFYRPALAAAEPSSPLVPVSQVREKLINEIKKTATSQLNDEQKQILINKISKRFADDGVEARANPNGYRLTSLYDNRINSARRGDYQKTDTQSVKLAAKLARKEAEIFGTLLKEVGPQDLPSKQFAREMEEGFLFADYLKALHGKKVPESVVGKATRLFGRAAAATVGGKVGGFPGAILGAQYGDMIFSGLQALPTNPLKQKFLNDLAETQPEVYKVLDDYIKKKGIDLGTVLKLPGTVTDPVTGKKTQIKASVESSGPIPGPRLFGTQGGKLTPNRQEAADLAAVESGAAKRPFTENPRWQQKVVEAQENLGAYLTPSQMESIMMGKKVKLKVDGKVIDIDANDLPKVFGPSLKNPPEAYIPEDKLPVIDFGSKPRPKKSLKDIYID